MGDSEAFVDSVYGFHAQQAAEKMLKAWLDALQVNYPGIHQIDMLLTYLQDAGMDTQEFRSLSELNSFGVQFRYDSSWRDEAPLDRVAILQAVHALRAKVLSAIG